MSLAALFPEGDYRFHLTLARGEPRDFFGPTPPRAALLAERARWLRDAPERYAITQPHAADALREIAALARGWGIAVEDAHALGRALEPDFVVLLRDATGVFRIAAGCVCFPTVWALAEKMGATLAETHGPVPGLNAALAPQLDAFLARLRPGVAWLRSNWGLSSSPELNQHPSRRPPPIALPIDPARVWLRVERQALLALPVSGGVLFGIRIENHTLADVRAEPAAARGLRHALATMPEEMARYKNLAAARPALIAALHDSSPR